MTMSPSRSYISRTLPLAISGSSDERGAHLAPDARRRARGAGPAFPHCAALARATYPRPPMSVAFLLCVERGPLESQTLLCVESLRRWGGALADSPVYAFAPRPGSEPARETVDALGELGARYVDEPLNPDLGELPHANKVFVTAWAEAHAPDDVFVFTDSDTVFLDEPAELSAGDWEAAARPVGAVNKGSTGEGHKNEADWQILYEVLGVSARPFLDTVVERTPARAYFNAGLVAIRRDRGSARLGATRPWPCSTRRSPGARRYAARSTSWPLPGSSPTASIA